jgi:replication factor A1
MINLKPYIAQNLILKIKMDYDINTLTPNAIQDLFSLTDKKTHEVNHYLQILNLKKCDQRRDSSSIMFTATLSDSNWKYNGFVIFADPSGNEELEAFDIIKVLTITPTNLESKKNRLFVIKKYEFVCKGNSLIGSPLLLKDEPCEKVQSQKEENQAPNLKDEDVHMNDSHVNGLGNNNVRVDNLETPLKERRNKAITPLKQLTTFSKDFKIQVRIIKKTDVKNYSTQQKTPGSVFSFVIQDEDGDEMQITCFNKAVNKFYDIIRENKIFLITGGYVKLNDRKFTSVKSDYKIVIDENTRVEEVEDDGSIQQLKFDFVKLSNLSNLPLYAVIDVIGYVKECGELIIKNTKNGDQPMKKLILVDDSGWKAECSLWRIFAHTEVHTNQIIALKNVKIGEFNGRNVSTFEESVVLLDPPYLKEAEIIRNFVENFTGEYRAFNSKDVAGNNEHGGKYTKVLYMKEVLEIIDDTTNDDKLNQMKIKATVTQLIHNDKNFYAGCLDLNCKKKLQHDSHGWNCVSCNKTYIKPNYYYTLSIRVKDCSFEYWIDMLGTVAEKFMKITAEEYKDILYDRNEARLREISNEIEFRTFIFSVRPKLHFYNSVPKKKLYVNRSEPVDVVSEANRLILKLKTDLNL